MQLISCGNFSFNLSYLFFLALFQTIREVLEIKILVSGKAGGWHCFFATFFMFLGEIVGGSMYFIYFTIIKKKNTPLDQFNTNNPNNSSIRITKIELDSLESETQQNNVFNLISYACLMATMDYIAFTLIALGSSESNLKLTTKIWQIIFTSLLSYFILSYSVYRHQFLSIGIIILGITFNYIFVGVYEQSKYWEGIIELMISYIMLSIKNTLEKYVMKKHFCEPLKLLFIEGIAGIIISTIINLIFDYTVHDSYFQIVNFNLQLSVFFQQNGMFYLILFFNFVCSVCINIFIFLINFTFTPTHLGIAYAFSTIFVFIVGLIINEDSLTPQIWAYFVSYFILNIGSIIYNELVILYCFNLNEYTRFQIHKRSRIELSKNMIEIRRYPQQDRNIFNEL